MDSKHLPNDPEACHQLIAKLQSQVGEQSTELQQQATELSLKDKLIEEQAHSVLELKAESDKLLEKNIELNLTLEKLLKQLYGRKSERRVDGEGQLFLNLGEEPTPEVVSALEDAIRDAERIVDDAEEAKQSRRRNRPTNSDRKFPEHLPRYERVVDLPEDRREGLTLIGYDEVVAWKYFYHLPFYRQQDLFGGSGWTPSRSTLQNIEADVEFALRPLAEYSRGVLKQDRTVGCDDTGVLLITPKALPDLSEHPRRERIGEVLENAIRSGKPSIQANMWGYHASRLPVVAFDFTVSRHRDGPDDVLGSS